MNFLDLIWLIPLFPLLGAVTMLLLGRKLDPQGPSRDAIAPALREALDRGTVVPEAHHIHGDTAPNAMPLGLHAEDAQLPHSGAAAKRLISYLCPGFVLLSFLLSAAATIQLAGLAARAHEVVLYEWIAGMPLKLIGGGASSLSAQLGFLLDPLSAVMILTVSGIGFLIHVYSVGYMAHDGGYYRFFGYLNLFVFFMLLLVLANNYLLLFVGWEGVGLCSYLLIGFYFHKKSASDAGNKAFLVNRIGDTAFLLATMLLFVVFGTVRFVDLGVLAETYGRQFALAAWGPIAVICILLLFASTGKSAQFPLFVWLPDAMEGPTPVSALIHAATMVTAGVYMIARSNALFRLAPEVSVIVAVVGAFTAILAASIALVQNDIKRVLAYSTVSQLGYMFLALGVGAYWVAVFHLFTHAFFKALLFLGSGSVIHALGGQQDIRFMGGLKVKIPVTFRTMFIGSLAIAGIPGLAGVFSQDEILWQTFSSPLGSKALYAVGLATAAMTAFYMWRMMFLTFYGKPRMDEQTLAHVHESPLTMTAPLVVLSAGSILVGWLAVPKVWSFLPDLFRSFEHWLEPVTGATMAALRTEALVHAAESGGHEAEEWALMGLSTALAVGGILLARSLYLHHPARVETLREKAGDFYTVLLNKWYLDEIYNAVFVRGLTLGGGRLLARTDHAVVDGGVNGAGRLTKAFSTISIWLDTYVVDGAVRLTAFATRLASIPVRLAQSGSVQSYALVIVIGVLILFGIYGRMN
ncbi:MAG: NADH-quinone oxidoreductase subunit L [Bryobacterales bacterium]|nr:NADH-quinone oxidoreductase subunit L [Bryobacterales bacterium]